MLEAANPYKSYVVSASAGSGKTYQLAHRFLHLVAAGADPSSILTITFTKKAAAEMRARIIEEAVHLYNDLSAQKLLDERLSQYARAPSEVGPRRSAVDTAASILSSTQSLRVTTIDSQFFDWIKRFPLEAGEGAFPDQFDLAQQGSDISEEAWERLSQTLAQLTSPLVREKIRREGLFPIKNRIQGLEGLETYLWLAREEGHELAGAHLHRSQAAYSHDTDVLNAMASELREIAATLKPALSDSVLASLQAGSLPDLLRCGLISKSYQVSGRYLRGDKRERLAAPIRQIESVLAAYMNHKALQYLNADAALFCELYKAYEAEREVVKFKQGMLEFSDLAKGCYRLFHGEHGEAARYLIARTTNHLLIDEFQDTSQLQWSIFSSLAKEMLSGTPQEATGVRSTVFIVGDEKQSIYGFREADPRVLNQAAHDLATFEVGRLSLSHSFRSADAVMDYTNAVFTNSMPDFPLHQAASLDGTPVTPDVGSITVADAFIDTDETAGIEAEADYVARTLQAALSDAQAYPVYDKQLKTMRPLEPRDCAILYRYSTRIETFEDGLVEHGVPYRRDDATGFFALQEIQDCLSLLKWIYSPCDLVSLCAALKSPLFQLADDTLMRGLAHTQSLDAAERWDALLATIDTPIAEQVRHLRQIAERPTLPHEVLTQAVSLCDAQTAYSQASGPEAGLLAHRNIMQLIALMQKTENQGITTGLSLLRSLEASCEQATFGSASLEANAVNLMTIHKSKGLEFAFVILVDTATAWEKRDRYWVKATDDNGERGVFYVGTKAEQPPSDVAFEQVFATLDRELQEESNRLLYVAITRARQHLLITGSHKDEVKADTAYARLRDAIQSLPHESRAEASVMARRATTAVSQANAAASQKAGATSTRTPELTAAPKWYPESIKTIRPHSLNSLEPVTIRKGATQAQTPSQEQPRLHGTLVHWLLERSVKGTPIEASQARAALANEGVAPAAFAKIYEEARTTVQRVLASDLWRDLVGTASRVVAEMPITVFRGQNQWMRGAMDLVVFHPGNRIAVVDYKTNQSRDARDYREQLRAYVEALRQVYPAHQVCGQVLLTHSLTLETVVPFDTQPIAEVSTLSPDPV